MDLSWNDITKEELRKLYCDDDLTDRQIAKMYLISSNKVTYKRRKFGISLIDKVYRDFVDQNSELFNELNSNSKERLLKRENIDAISKSITHFAFRNGPIEGMHAKSQLSENDMKTLNIYMVNRIAGLLTAIADNNWLQLELLFAYYKRYGISWENAEPDMKGINTVIRYTLEDINGK